MILYNYPREGESRRENIQVKRLGSCRLVPQEVRWYEDSFSWKGVATTVVVRTYSHVENPSKIAMNFQFMLPWLYNGRAHL
jgi:hypothetical protein